MVRPRIDVQKETWRRLMAELHLMLLFHMPCTSIHPHQIQPGLVVPSEIMAPEGSSHKDIEWLVYQYRMTNHQQIQARDAQRFAQLGAIPFDYLPSTAAHSSPFLPRGPDASRSFIEQAETQLKEILPRTSRICCALVVKNSRHSATVLIPLWRNRSLTLLPTL